MDIVARQAEFAVLAQALEDELSPAERDLLGRAMRARPKSTRTYGFEDLGAAVHVPLGAIAALDPPRARAVSRALIAGLCASNAAELGQGLGPRVGVRIDDALTRLLPWLDRETPPGYSFPEDLFLKDYRFATGMTLPCGAQVVDLAGWTH
ncbi:hypothetical protein J4558_04640 [Leptolyngbya sp. 15MV]|nr:hypothetical protein J4558_04640 [Leptolyngbya sp. 15MV]